MKKLAMVLLGTAGIGAAMLLTPLTPVGALIRVCPPMPLVPPVPHWIDACSPGGVDHFDRTGALVGVNLGTTNCNVPPDQNLILYGPVDVVRQAPSDDSANFPGLRPVDGHLDVIDTEIVSMNLTGSGVTLMVGKNTPGINPAVPRTFGAVAEEAANSSLGDSFFDVFFEVTGVPGGPVYSHTPLRVQAVISDVPPDVVYLHPTSLCLPLYNDPAGGVQLYNLVEAYHDTTTNIGGIAELPQIAQSPGEAGAPAEGSGWSAGNYAALAGGLAAGAAAIAAGGWYARRRWLR